MERITKIIVLILLIGACGLFLVSLQDKQDSSGTTTLLITTSSDNLEITKTRQNWKDDIQKNGASAVYADLKKLSSQNKTSDQHFMAHLFGEVLFQQKGVQGISVCDPSFTFGCYHGFFTKAVVSKGIGILKNLEKECMDAFKTGFKACTHGIGHGVVEYKGHDNIVASLDVCSTLSSEDELLYGCKSGALMEYFAPSTIDENGERLLSRELDREKPYQPCPSLPGKYRPVCYYELTALWLVNLSPEKMGELCGDIDNKDERIACFKGVGNYGGPFVLFDVDKAIGLCNKMPSSEGVIACKIETSWSFFGNPVYRHKAPFICKGLSSEVQAKCVQEKDV